VTNPTVIVMETTDRVYGVHLGKRPLAFHSADWCSTDPNPCVIHSPSEHHMREWPMLWRADRQLMERACPHGTGHPDPDDLAYHVRHGREWQSNHGCDGCCVPPEGP
jgi:hypothetical protein